MKNSKLMFAVSGVVGLMSWASTQAAFTLYFRGPTSGASTQVITDNGPDDNDDTVGIIDFSYSDPDSGTLTVSFSSSNATTGDGLDQPAIVQQSTLQFQGNPDGHGSVFFDIAALEDGFTFPGAIGSAMRINSRLTGTFSSAVGASVAFASAASPNLVITPTLSYTSVSAVNDHFDYVNDDQYIRTATPYSVANEMVFTIPVTGNATLTGVTTVFIPEPGSMLSLLGVPALAIRRRAR